MTQEFNIMLLKKRSSFLNDLSTVFLVVAILGLGIFYLSMSPSEKSSTELQVLWFIEGVPNWVKQVTLYSLLILPIFFLIKLINRRSENGILKIDVNGIIITTNKRQIELTYQKMKEIEFVNRILNPSNSLDVLFKMKTDDVIRIRFPHYFIINDVFECLSNFSPDGLKISAILD